MAIVALENVTKTYQLDGAAAPEFPALRGVSLAVWRATFTSLMGPSGSGKTTLLNLMGGLDVPDSGRIEIDGADLAGLDDRALSRLRLEKIGFVFQFFNLLPNLSARANVELPLRLLGRAHGDTRESAAAAVGRVGLADKIDRMPHELSGGEMQRIAIARAIAHRPALILADEPTGNLDSRTGESILALLRELVADDGLTLIMASHDARGRDIADRHVEIIDGKIVGDDALSKSPSARETT